MFQFRSLWTTLHNLLCVASSASVSSFFFSYFFFSSLPFRLLSCCLNLSPSRSGFTSRNRFGVLSSIVRRTRSFSLSVSFYPQSVSSRCRTVLFSSSIVQPLFLSSDKSLLSKSRLAIFVLASGNPPFPVVSKVSASYKHSRLDVLLQTGGITFSPLPT